MSPKYTLYYFNVRGLAEVSRLILAHAGVEYDDKRVDKEEEWPKLKNEMPFNHLPVLEANGVHISESRSIARYLAKEHGLAGKNSIEAALADSIVEALSDLMFPMFQVIRETDPAKQDDLRKALVAVMEPMLNNVDKIRQKHGGSGFLVGDSLTWADIATADVVWILSNVVPEEIVNHKVLVEHQQKILSLPGIREWIEKRPVTDV